ncbi:MAG: carboxypeptidase M32 [Gaiellales bacterium]
MADAHVWDAFAARMHELSDLGGVMGLLGWDEQVMCPPGGREARAQHGATLAAIHHQRLVDPAYGEAIEAATALDGLGEAERAMLREARRQRDRATKLPEAFVRRLAEQRSRTNQAWEQARETGAFADYRPALEELVRLKVEEADLLKGDGTRYDALLDDFEPGMRLERLAPLLADLRERLVPFAQRILDAPAPDVSVLERGFDPAAQEALSVRMLRDLGFDLARGRQDRSTHPFTGGTAPTDIRLTTRIWEHWLPACLYASIHECGHGLYEQGIAEPLWRSSVCGAPSLGLHESQSRFYENAIGRSLAFWEHYLPVAREHFPGQLDDVDALGMQRAVCRVARTPIRVESDEVTYNLHILLRFELEVELVEGRVRVGDLPEAWNARMEEYLGYTPRDDVEGVMQDVHWSEGLFGYFPTYTLGNLYAAGLLEAMRRDLAVDDLVRAGEFAPVLAWLRDRVHRHGAVPAGEDLMRAATGRELGADAFMAYLEERYGVLYGL